MKWPNRRASFAIAAPLCLLLMFVLAMAGPPSRSPITISFVEGNVRSVEDSGSASWVCIATNSGWHSVRFWAESIEYKTRAGWIRHSLPFSPEGQPLFSGWLAAASGLEQAFSLPSYLTNGGRVYQFPPVQSSASLGPAGGRVCWRVRCRYQNAYDYDFSGPLAGFGWALRGSVIVPGSRLLLSQEVAPVPTSTGAASLAASVPVLNRTSSP
jgi:hypothetical protein